MEEGLLKLLSNRFSAATIARLQEQNMLTLFQFFQCTPAEILRNFPEDSNNFLHCYRKAKEYFSPNEISNFLLKLFNPPIEREDDIRQFEESVHNLLLNYSSWDDLFEFIAEILTSDYSHYVQNSLMLFSYTIRSITELKGIKADQYLNDEEYLKILTVQKHALNFRIPIPRVNLQILSDEILIAKENCCIQSQVFEYFKRIKRTNTIEPKPMIKLQIPAKMDDIQNSVIFNFELETCLKFIEEFPASKIEFSIYNVVSFFGKIGSGKSGLIRSGISSEEKYAPKSAFQMCGTSKDIHTYRTSFDEMLGSKLNSGENGVMFLDTEGYDAASRNSENLTPEQIEIMNECLKFTLPLIHIISTVIVFVLNSADEIRTNFLNDNLEKFKRGMGSNDYRKPALIIVLNKCHQINENEFQNQISELEERLKEELKDCLFSVDLFLMPIIPDFEEGKNITKEHRECYYQLVNFYQLLITKIEQVNQQHSNGKFVQSMYTLDSTSYIPLLTQVCECLPRTINQREFWNKVILHRLKLRSNPHERCKKYFLELLTISSKSNDTRSMTYLKNMIEGRIESIYLSFWILDLLNSKECIKDNLDNAIKELIEFVPKVKSGYEELSLFISKSTPCGEPFNGIHCTLPHHDHSDTHKSIEKILFFSRERKIHGNYHPLLMINETLDLGDESSYRKLLSATSIDNNFCEHQFFRNLIRLMIDCNALLQSTSFSSIGSCIICLKDVNDRFFSCGKPHSLCENCLERFLNSLPEESICYCPFCDEKPQKEVQVSHIPQILSFDYSIGTHKYCSISPKIQPNEPSILILSIVGELNDSSLLFLENFSITKNWNIPLPKTFVQFVRCCRAVKFISMFFEASESLAIIYYCCDTSKNAQISNLKILAKSTSTLTVNFNDKSLKQTQFWENIFTMSTKLNSDAKKISSPIASLRNFACARMHENDKYITINPDEVDLRNSMVNLSTHKYIFYNRAVWSSLMSAYLPTRSFSHYSQALTLHTIYKSYLKIDEDQTQISFNIYFIKEILFSALEVLLRERDNLSVLQLMNVLYIQCLKLLSPLQLADSLYNYFKILLDQYLSDKYQFIISLNSETLSIWRIETLISIKQLKSKKISLMHIFNTRIQNMEKRIRICLTCYLEFPSIHNRGCEKHPICLKCWESGVLSLIESTYKNLSLPPRFENLISEIGVKNLFNCFICDQFLIQSFTHFVSTNEKESFYLGFITHSIFEDRSIYEIIGIGTSPIYKRNYIKKSTKYAYHQDLESFTGYWTDSNRKKKIVAIKELPSNQISYCNYSTLFSQLPYFVNFYGIKEYPRNESIFYVFQFIEGTQTLSEYLSAETLVLTPKQVIFIAKEIARALRTLNMAGIFCYVHSSCIIVKHLKSILPITNDIFNNNNTDFSNQEKRCSSGIPLHRNCNVTYPSINSKSEIPFPTPNNNNSNSKNNNNNNIQDYIFKEGDVKLLISEIFSSFSLERSNLTILSYQSLIIQLILYCVDFDHFDCTSKRIISAIKRAEKYFYNEKNDLSQEISALLEENDNAILLKMKDTFGSNASHILIDLLKLSTPTFAEFLNGLFKVEQLIQTEDSFSSFNQSPILSNNNGSVENYSDTYLPYLYSKSNSLPTNILDLYLENSLKNTDRFSRFIAPLTQSQSIDHIDNPKIKMNTN